LLGVRSIPRSNSHTKIISAELGEIGLEEGYHAPASGCKFISSSMRRLQGRKTGRSQDIDMVTRRTHVINIDGSSLNFNTHSQLIRATSLLHKMYMAFRRAIFERNILHAEERHGILYFVEDNNTFDVSTGHFLFRSLPKEVVKDSPMSAQLLMYLECGQSIVDMTAQIELLISSEYQLYHSTSLVVLNKTDLCLDIQEVDIMVKNARRPTCCTYYGGTHGNNMIGRHTILSITTHDGQAWAIDLTAAQFGWTEALVPWDIYMAQRVRTIINVQPFGAYDQVCKGIAASSSTFGIIQEAQTKMRDCSNNIVSDWLRRDGLTPAQLLNLSDHEYVLKETHLMTALQDGLQASVKDLRQSGLYRYYLKSTPHMTGNIVSLTRSRREYKREKKS
jgi:hypothetical protein